MTENTTTLTGAQTPEQTRTCDRCGRSRPDSTERFVHYRLLAPEVYTPPNTHTRETEPCFVAVYDPQLETLDELGIIEVVEWGGNQ